MEGMSDSRLGNKRARDGGGALSEVFLVQEPTCFKKLCTGCDIQDANISCIFDTVTEVDEIYDHVELDEVQERLIFGVMRSLEEELGVSRPLSIVSSENVDDNSSPLLDSDTNFIVEDTCRFDERIQDDATYPSDDNIFYTGKGPLSSIVAAKDSESMDLLEKFSQISDAKCPRRIDSVQGESLSFSAKVKPERVKAVDIGYLLEASDDELGISPSPNSENSIFGADTMPCTFQETDYTSMESTSESLDPTPCQYRSDWSSGSHFDIDFESDPSTQEWMKNVLSSLEAGMDRFIGAQEAAAAACLEPACAAH